MCRDTCSPVVLDSIEKADAIINDPKYKTILVSISGGSDSDDVLDLCTKLDVSHKCFYVWFNTGLECTATKEHLKYLESKYHVTIHVQNPIKPIPVSCKEYGQPFLSKMVSEYMERLQKHDFQWEDEPFEVLLKKYPNCQSALRWWCNRKNTPRLDAMNRSEVRYNRYLKEFIILNPPTFRISNKCCYYAKKKVSEDVRKEWKCDLIITGIRKAEGGIRATSYKSCFDKKEDVDNLRPIFWWNNDDKSQYESTLNVLHSKCYTEYGLERTGCVGCPYGLKLDFELEVLHQYEPSLYKAASNVFKDSYEYTKKYREFCANMRAKGIKPRLDAS